jgi:hypothetical protein
MNSVIVSAYSIELISGYKAHFPRTFTYLNAVILLYECRELDLGEVEWGDVDWIGLAQDRNRWGALVNSVTNLRVP